MFAVIQEHLFNLWIHSFISSIFCFGIGQPSSQPGRNCGAVNQQYDSKWSTDDCSARHGYICQKVLQTPTIPPSNQSLHCEVFFISSRLCHLNCFIIFFPVVHTGSCPRPWIPYLGHCYYLNRAKKTWSEAKDSCRRDGGDLLSILSVEEQSFAISQLGYCEFLCRCFLVLHDI